MFYFVIGPNNSGTTVVCQYLAAQADAYLPPFGHNEGQFAPQVKAMLRKDPWDPHKTIDWPLVRDAWTELLTASGKSIFVEGSPPNLLRVPQIFEVFAPDYKAIFLISDPYMHVASNLKNYATPPLTDARIRQSVAAWAMKAGHMRRNHAEWPRVPLIRYEDFCEQPDRVNVAFDLPVRANRTDIAGKKTSGITEIRDLSVRNLAFLCPPEVAVITQALQDHRDLVEHFGYRLLDETALAEKLAQAPDLASAGQLTRQRWSKPKPLASGLRWIKQRKESLVGTFGR